MSPLGAVGFTGLMSDGPDMSFIAVIDRNQCTLSKGDEVVGLGRVLRFPRPVIAVGTEPDEGADSRHAYSFVASSIFDWRQNVKVLLVEADTGLRESLAALLDNASFTVLQADNASTALRSVPSIDHRDILIIRQCLHSDMTGFDLAGRIREHRPLAPLILMIGQQDVTPVFSIGSNDRLLGIPFAADRLFQLIVEVTDTSLEDDAGFAATGDEEDVQRHRNSMWLTENDQDKVPFGWLPRFRWPGKR